MKLYNKYRNISFSPKTVKFTPLTVNNINQFICMIRVWMDRHFASHHLSHHASARITPLTKHKTITGHDTVTSYSPKPLSDFAIDSPNCIEDRRKYLAKTQWLHGVFHVLSNRHNIVIGTNIGVTPIHHLRWWIGVKPTNHSGNMLAQCATSCSWPTFRHHKVTSSTAIL